MIIRSKNTILICIIPVLFVLLFTNKAYSQDSVYIRQKTDSLINNTDFLSRNSRMLESVGKRIRTEAQKTDYPQGLAYGNLLLARHLYLTDHYEKSISFLEQVQEQKIDK